VFGTANAARVRREYAPESFASPHQALVQATTDALFTCQSRRVARALANAQPQPVYRYVFGHTLDNDPEQKAGGASHTIEHAFFFPWQGTYRPTEADLAVQRTMLRSWSEFARAGSLAGQRDPVWLPLTQDRDSYLFIAPSPALRSGSGDAHCEFWDGITLPWPRL
jgi:para-nitrobenzyl esterase